MTFPKPNIKDNLCISIIQFQHLINGFHQFDLEKCSNYSKKPHLLMLAERKRHTLLNQRRKGDLARFECRFDALPSPTRNRD